MALDIRLSMKKAAKGGCGRLPNLRLPWYGSRPFGAREAISMRLLIAAAVYAAMTVCGFAQGPKEIGEIETIKIYPGETKIFTFDQSISDIKATGENIKIVPETDRTFALVGIAPGAVVLTAFNSEAKLVYRSRVVIVGNVVRIYGTGTVDEKKSDYVGYVCTDVGCGRADPGIERRASGTVERTRTNTRGQIITTTTTRD
jgi:hypothetical protein